MKILRPILYLVFVSLLADGICWPLATGVNFPAPALILGYALAFSQVSLLTIWAGLASTAVWFRLPILAGGYLLAVQFLKLLHDNDGGWFILLGMQVGVVLLPLLMARLCRVRLERYHGGENPFAPRPLQFSLRRLMAAITALAIACGIARHFDLSQSNLEEGVLIGSGFAVVALTGVWAGLGSGSSWLKMPVLVIVSLVTGYTIAVFTGPPGDRTPIVLLVVLQTAFLGGSLGVLRKCQYRLMRWAPNAASR
jgi:hypothetical protein